MKSSHNHLSKSVLTEAPNDPLLREAELPLSRRYYPYGVPLLLRTNSPLILEAAAQSWGHFEQGFDDAPVELHLGVTGSAEGPAPLPPVYRSRKHVLTITGDAEHFGVCDFETGFGYGWLTPRALDDLAAVRFFYLEALGYSLVSDRRLAPVHGACVSWKGKGVLLCGDSHAGKSTLAYACARRGFTYSSDDGSFLIRGDGGCTVLGNPNSIRFRPSATGLFPELSQFPPLLRSNGKLAIEVPTASLPMQGIAYRTQVEQLVFLNRVTGFTSAQLLPFSKETALAYLERSLNIGRESTLREQQQSLHRLLNCGVFELLYENLDAAVDRLQTLLETGL